MKYNIGVLDISTEEQERIYDRMYPINEIKIMPKTINNRSPFYTAGYPQPLPLKAN